MQTDRGRHLTVPNELGLAMIAGAGLIAGLGLVIRGLGGYRAAGRISETSTSRIASLAVGEVLVSGIAEPIELTLISPLQSAPCVYYRARVTDAGDDDDDILNEERAVGFRVRDGSGAVRIFPQGARFDVPDRYDESAGAWDGAPAGLQPRTGPAFGPGPADREAQIASLLTVHDPGRDPGGLLAPRRDDGFAGFDGSPLGATTRRRHYREARIEAGDPVTVVGQVLPFADLADPMAANLLDGAAVGSNDPEIVADLAEARAAGHLAASAEEARGNAAIAGFGIGRPVRAPVLDPEADLPPPPDPALAARATAAFVIPPDALVFATSEDVPMLISLGLPGPVAARQEERFIVGLFGAVLAIISAMGLALLLDGGLR